MLTETPRQATVQATAGPRRLEIGPRDIPLAGYEHLDIHASPHIEHVADASQPLPFEDDTFDEIYASHIIEHIPWYKTEQTLREWYRITKPGGFVEVWTNDFEKLCRRYLKKRDFCARTNEHRELNPDHKLQRWVNLKLFWRDHLGRQEEWHRAVFDFAYLRYQAARAGFNVTYRLERHENHGADHGMLEFGIRAYKHADAARVLRDRRAWTRADRRRALAAWLGAAPERLADSLRRAAQRVASRIGPGTRRRLRKEDSRETPTRTPHDSRAS